MSTAYPHPSLGQQVTPEQRERAEVWLQEAYADGRLTEDEFDRRIGQVISSSTRRDLNQAFYGLVQVPTSPQAMNVHSAYSPLARNDSQPPAGRGAAGLAHFSAFFLWLFGPLLFFALSRPGSYPRKEAAKAFNFQLVSLAFFIGGGVVSGITNVDAILGTVIVAWFVLTIVGGAKALQGEDWRNPVKKVVKLDVLSER